MNRAEDADQTAHRREPFVYDHNEDHDEQSVAVNRADYAETLDVDTTPNDVETDVGAWLCVLGAFTFALPSYGFMQSIGTVQSYLHLHQLKEYSVGEVGWIPGAYLFLSYFFNIQIGPICDYDGPLPIGSIGVAITVGSFLIVAECKEYWQFMLCIGFLAALGGAMIATVGMSAIAKLFVRRQGLAMGLALAGSAIGSIVFPIMLRSLLPQLGWRWTMRIVAFVIAGFTVPGLLCFLPYQRLTASLPDQRLARRSEALLDLSAFKSIPFTLISLGSFLLEFAIFGVAGLLPSVALRAGFSLEDSYLLVVVVSSCSCFGRILPGMAADLFGPFNVIALTNIFTIICMVSLFIPFAHTSGALLYVFSAFWGFGSGSFLSVPPVCLGKICTTKAYGRYFGERTPYQDPVIVIDAGPGTTTFFCSFAVLLTVPLGGIMLEALGSQALAGLLTANVILGGLCYYIARFLIIGKWLSLTVKV